MHPPPDIAASAPTALTRPFWDAAAQGKLLLQFDPATGRHQFFPRPVSLATGTTRLEWRQASGRGTVASFTTIQLGAPPYLLAGIDLEEGVRVLAPLLEIEPDAVRIGLPVRLHWLTEGRAQPLFAFVPDPPDAD
jgi:uncharacterized OB-fold protein